ncbi:MAG: efflux RND transporter permease subunit [SAR324 cluster bacterium]|nr:efflux RND transporter permease subunit [SAR324 cluster bacterium]
MALIRFFLEKPAIVAALIAFVIVSGLTALLQIPIQLTPDVETPQLTVQTIWPGASPYEVEKEIVIKQEEALRNVTGLVQIRSESWPGRGQIILEFAIGTDLDNALLRVSNELDQVVDYPENSLRPRILTSGINSSPVVWTQLSTTEGNPRPIGEYFKYAEEEIAPEFEKIPGVSQTRIFGGREKEIQILFDSEKLATYHISISALINTIRKENIDISGGSIDEGKRKYVVRTLTKFRNVQDLGNLIIRKNEGQSIYLRDVAEVGIGYQSPTASVLINNQFSMVLPVYREHGANVLEVTEKVIETIERLNKQKLAGEKLKIQRLSDPRYYINSAIRLVINNLFIGGFLAFCVLLLFLGDFRSSLVVILAIPISIIGTFVFLHAFGRNINVISLAGLAFAVGMVVDSAIVVLENIDQYRLRGNSLYDSALKATHDVWGAILASSLTTMAVFLPVVFVKEKAGQLFADISIAICSAIMLALVVAVVVIPSLYMWLLKGKKIEVLQEGEKTFSFYQGLRKKAGRLVNFCLSALRWILKTWKHKFIFLVSVLLVSVLLIYAAMPKLEYLPGGNRNLLFGYLIPPSGYNTEEYERIGRFLMKELDPYLKGEEPNYPQIDRVFYVGFGTILIIGAVSKDPQRVSELIPVINKTLSKIPGMYGVTQQSSLFERGLAAGRSIDIEIYADHLEDITRVGQGMFGQIRGIIPGGQVRPIPSLEIGTPEIQVLLNPERAAAMGLSTQELGLIVDVYTDGRKIDEFVENDGNILDITLASKDNRVKSVADFSSLSLTTPSGQRIPIASVAEIVEQVGPNQINRIAQSRVITLRVSPPENISLDEALHLIEDKIVTPALEKNKNMPGFRIELSGTAGDFTKTRLALQTGFLIALGITFLLLAVLFENFFYPLVIMGSLPVAGAGGMLLLSAINHFVAPQPLDVLVMLGFLMLIGIVVNNPILIVAKALQLIRNENFSQNEAVLEAVKVRIRPIFMSTMTSVLGLLPLVVVPGAGSELYRGLGSAVLGGLLLSTLVSIFFVPVLFSFFIDLQEGFQQLVNRSSERKKLQNT